MIYLVHFEDKSYISLLHFTKTRYTSKKTKYKYHTGYFIIIAYLNPLNKKM